MAAMTGENLGEQLLNKAASTAIRHLFSQAESVEVSIRCSPPSKLLQGSLDSFRMDGRGLVIRRQFRVETMSFETDAVAIDFAEIMQGQVRLKQTTQAVAQVVLTEADLNQAFTAELVTRRLRQLSLPSLSEQPVSFEKIQLELLRNNRVRIEALTCFADGTSVPIQFIATLALERRRRILFTQPLLDCPAIDGSTERGEACALAFVELLNGLVDLDRFDLDGVTLRLNRLETQSGRLVFSGYAQIEHFPHQG
ncbi:DUF2993 domain-containing protein [Leptolyngbya sp. FACHB-261]|nr:DUF2993 domain-containing protein [Leptolyngbya sp. FACHB-261]